MELFGPVHPKRLTGNKVVFMGSLLWSVGNNLNPNQNCGTIIVVGDTRLTLGSRMDAGTTPRNTRFARHFGHRCPSDQSNPLLSVKKTPAFIGTA